MSKSGMLRHEPWATSPSIDRTIDGLVIGVDELRRGDPDDAAMPARRRRRRGRCGRRPPDRFRWPCAPAATSSASSCCRFRFSSFSCCASPRASCSSALSVARSRRVAISGRAHASGRVDARGEHEGDLVRVDGLAGEAAAIEQRAQADGVRPGAQRGQAEAGDDAVLPDQRHHVGERADRGDLHEGGQPLGAAGADAEGLHAASAPRRPRRGACPDSCSRGVSGSAPRPRAGSSVSGS